MHNQNVLWRHSENDKMVLVHRVANTGSRHTVQGVVEVVLEEATTRRVHFEHTKFTNIFLHDSRQQADSPLT